MRIFYGRLVNDHNTGWPPAFAAGGIYNNVTACITLYGRIVTVTERIDNRSIAAIQQIPNLCGNISQCFKIKYFYFKFIATFFAVVIDSEF